jgi:hypothetical protein
VSGFTELSKVHLELESTGLLPGELLVGEVAVLGGLGVDGTGQVKVLHDDTGTQIEVVTDDLDQLVGGLVGGTVGLNEDGEGLSDTNGVGELNKGTAGQAGGDQRLSDPAGDVSSGTIDLGVVLSGESTTTVGTPTTVGINNDLTASETGITLGTTDDETARGLDVVDSAVIKQLSGNDLANNLLLDNSAKLLSGDIVTVLGGDDNSVDAKRLDATVVVGVFNGNLGLGIGAQPGDGAIVTGSLHGGVELVGEEDSQGQELRGLVGGIAEHDTLVTGTELLKSLLVVETLSNIGGLLLNGNQDVASLVVETLLRGIVTDVLDSVTDDLLVVQTSIGGNLTEDHNHT